ncbi:uncharacterized protein LOC116029694 [Ipomoea triloba]|uniref:uncharacterized protein LOC116029694 n=1 Tax=Ipomoea triloba TaxID=35885 RepID=UPI00125E2ED9|nr:uncharacterized protein LOC116029694 [Ipomoea triloba]
MTDGSAWNSTFVYVLWMIWKDSNNLIFNDKREPPDQVVELAGKMAAEARNLITRHAGVANGAQKWICWSPPQPGWVKLNTDGAMKLLGRAVGPKGGSTALPERGFENVWVEMDSAAVVAILNGGLSGEATITSLIKDCLDLVKKLHRFRASHIEREGNKCADWLANHGQIIDWGTLTLHNAPIELNDLLNADAHGTPALRIR